MTERGSGMKTLVTVALCLALAVLDSRGDTLNEAAKPKSEWSSRGRILYAPQILNPIKVNTLLDTTSEKERSESDGLNNCSTRPTSCRKEQPKAQSRLFAFHSRLHEPLLFRTKREKNISPRRLSSFYSLSKQYSLLSPSTTPKSNQVKSETELKQKFYPFKKSILDPGRPVYIVIPADKLSQSENLYVNPNAPSEFSDELNFYSPDKRSLQQTQERLTRQNSNISDNFDFWEEPKSMFMGDNEDVKDGIVNSFKIKPNILPPLKRQKPILPFNSPYVETTFMNTNVDNSKTNPFEINNLPPSPYAKNFAFSNKMVSNTDNIQHRCKMKCRSPVNVTVTMKNLFRGLVKRGDIYVTNNSYLEDDGTFKFSVQINEKPSDSIRYKKYMGRCEFKPMSIIDNSGNPVNYDQVNNEGRKKNFEPSIDVNLTMGDKDMFDSHQDLNKLEKLARSDNSYSIQNSGALVNSVAKDQRRVLPDPLSMPFQELHLPEANTTGITVGAPHISALNSQPSVQDIVDNRLKNQNIEEISNPDNSGNSPYDFFITRPNRDITKEKPILII